MERVRTTHHSGLYLRNTFIVWATTILVFWLALNVNRHWLSMSVFLLALYFCFFLWMVYLSVHPGRSIFRYHIPRLEVGLECEKVEFLSQDGVELCGWFLEGRKQQVIILIHGLGGSGLAMSSHARMLWQAGYSVLMPDLRGHGGSAGDTITGELGIYDIYGAIEFLETRPEVNTDEIGILGVSFGALVALKAAAQIKSIRAVVLESLGPATLDDHGGRPTTLKRWINYPINWLSYTLFAFMCGVETKDGVVESLHLIYPRPVLFISTGRGKERYFMRLFHTAARYPKSILEVPRAAHGIALAVNSQEYCQQVLQIFNQALG